MCTGVHTWQEDPSVPKNSSSRLKAVLCSEYVAALEQELVKISTDKDLPQKILKTCKTSWREELEREPRRPRYQREADKLCARYGHIPFEGKCRACGRIIKVLEIEDDQNV